MAIATTATLLYKGDDRRERMKSIFHPMLRSEMIESFYAGWEEWFVLTDKVEDLRRPGLLKSKHCFIFCLRFIILRIFFID